MKLDTPFMLTHFGWKAVIRIVVANLIYFAIFRREFATLRRSSNADAQPEQWSDRTDPVPAWITAKHLAFLGCASDREELTSRHARAELFRGPEIRGGRPRHAVKAAWRHFLFILMSAL